MSNDISLDLPKLKRPVSTDEKKATKKVSKPKTEKKAEAPKAAKSLKKAEAKKVAAPKKSEKAAKSVKAKVEKKAEVKSAKPVKETAKAKGKAVAVSADDVAKKITKLVATGKVEAVKDVDYASSKSVVEGLVAKAATVLLKTFSDKAIAAVKHDNADVAKAVKEVLIKNASNVRATAIAKDAKKFAGLIAKAAKTADAGKLTAADYRAVAFA